MSSLKFFIAVCLLALCAISSAIDKELTEDDLKEILKNELGPLFANNDAKKTSKSDDDDFEMELEGWFGGSCSGGLSTTTIIHDHTNMECVENDKIKFKYHDAPITLINEQCVTVRGDTGFGIAITVSYKATWEGWCTFKLPTWAIVLITLATLAICITCCYFCCCKKEKNHRYPYPANHTLPPPQQQVYSNYPPKQQQQHQQVYVPNYPQKQQVYANQHYPQTQQHQQYNQNPQVEIYPKTTSAYGENTI